MSRISRYAVEFTAYNYAEVLIPDEFIDHFDGENYYKLAFDFDVAIQHEEAEFVTYGSYFLDKVIDLASQRGLTCKRHIVDSDVELRKPAAENCQQNHFQKLSGNFHD